MQQPSTPAQQGNVETPHCRLPGCVIKLCALQIDTASRGFSFARDGPLDMRMGPSAQHSAEEIVNTWPEADLGRIFREWGEERAWRRIAAKIVAVRLFPSLQLIWAE